MKKTKRLINLVILMLLALALTIPSCKKDETNLSKKEMLTAKSWKILSSKTNGIAETFDDCQKDDFLTFATNGNYTFNPGTIKCDAIETIETGTWTLSSDEKFLIVDGESITIIELSSNRFTFSLKDGDYTFEATYISF